MFLISQHLSTCNNIVVFNIHLTLIMLNLHLLFTGSRGQHDIQWNKSCNLLHNYAVMFSELKITRIFVKCFYFMKTILNKGACPMYKIVENSLSKYWYIFYNIVTLKLIHFSLIVKQVLTTYLNCSQVRFLEPTSTGVICGIMVVTCLGFEPMILRLQGRHLRL